MSDRFSGQIWIGGKLSSAARLYPDDPDDYSTVLEGLISALSNDGATKDFGDIPIDSFCSEEYLLANFLDDCIPILRLSNEQACNGEFQNTEDFCREHNISYDRWSDHYCEYNSENVYWRPGMSHPLVIISDSSGNEMVSGEKVREATIMISNVYRNCKPSEGQKAFIERALKILTKICPQLPPNLEHFEIIH